MEPSRELAAAMRRYQHAQDALEQARAQLHAAIASELANNVRQVDVARATGYTREHIRQIARANAQ